MTPDTPRFRIGQTVYHVADEDPGVVIAITYYASGITYVVGWDKHFKQEYAAGELSEFPFYGSTGDGEGDDEQQHGRPVEPRRPVPAGPGRN